MPIIIIMFRIFYYYYYASDSGDSNNQFDYGYQIGAKHKLIYYGVQSRA
jgi:hypothetical protein